MENELISTLTATFEGHAQTTEDGVEYWLASELQCLIGYTKWDHFVDVNKMVELGSGSKRDVQDIMLNRYTCLPLVVFATRAGVES